MPTLFAMTYEEFLEKLRGTPRTWRLDSGCIRCGPRLGDHLNGRHCPMSAVAGVLNIGMPSVLAEKLNLPLQTAKDIQYAADNDDPLLLKARARPRILEVRRDLLEACGLKEGRR
jgi:hypothetical protein